MKKPLVAVSLRHGSSARTVKERNYLNWVSREGGIPVVIHPGKRDPLRGVSGLLLTGGEDVAPWRYGQKDRLCEEVNPERDRFEFRVLNAALREGLPVLAVCRGVQVLGVARGGALHQDLSDRKTPPVKRTAGVSHRGRKQTDGMHFVKIFGKTELKKCVRAGTLRVNSNHHQAISRVPKSVRVAARAADGTVEAIEIPGRNFVLGIQWHPERWKSAASRAIMKRFLSACHKRAKRKAR